MGSRFSSSLGTHAKNPVGSSRPSGFLVVAYGWFMFSDLLRRLCYHLSPPFARFFVAPLLKVEGSTLSEVLEGGLPFE